MKKLSIFLAVIFGALLLSEVIVNVATAASNRPTAVNSAATNGQANGEQKLTEAKLKACQNRENAIQTRSKQLTKTAENMLTTFDKIAERVEQYYTSKVVPSGKTVPNYDALVADITSKKQTVQTDLDKATADATAFSCTGNDPKGQLTQFRTDMQTVKKDLKEYRTAIKNLIVAVRKVTGTTNSSPSPTSSQ